MKTGTMLLKGKNYIKTLFPGFVKLWKKNKKYHGLDNLDKRLKKYLNKKNGFFIEVGANDGVSQSNTLWLEKNMGWGGILIEAIPSLSEQCRINRPKCEVFNCACVADEHKKNTIKIIYADLMSTVVGHKTKQEEKQFLCSAKQFCEKQFELEVPARTMTSILDECNVKDIDFMSLDVEGYEVNVLKGLDLDRYQPSFLLIEAEDKELLEAHLKGRYVFVEKLSAHDYLYKHISTR